ncbi:hypothetical protein TSOC_005538 [Tetrabaena socialis]|uniref:Uncharacterized protein n=1 Tax=Tetrabaena socialis TaxID=47790 RepID=A0A2J8A5Z0_9CHLO|nr:hypothetical protein TSOC_005538 [Tetrabaena socialis]|eukprot:PNH07946.1 hypothetical protein TSOC_005538 [Tetrabaena socialis]
MATQRAVLYDVPVSNNGARNRYIIRRKGLEGEIDIVSPQASRIMEEIRGALQGWAANNRWRDQGILDHVADKSHKWAY